MNNAFQSQCLEEIGPDFFEALGLKGVIHTVASHFELTAAYDRTLCFTLSPANATLFNERHQRSLASAIEQVLDELIQNLLNRRRETSLMPLIKKRGICW